MNIGVSTGKAGMFVTVRDGDKMVQIDPRDLLAQTRLKMFYQLKPEVQRMLRKQQRRPPRLILVGVPGVSSLLPTLSLLRGLTPRRTSWLESRHQHERPTSSIAAVR